jgi:hypothetical protein
MSQSEAGRRAAASGRTITPRQARSPTAKDKHIASSNDTSIARLVRPNPSLNHRTCYGKRRKPGLRHMVHHLSPGLRRLPPQAG